jgi:hypothetical protein
MNHDQAFSPQERAALDLWTTPAPPVDFAARVLARAARADDVDGDDRIAAVPLADPRNGPPFLSAFAAAAVFALLLCGMWSLRGLGGGAGGTGADPGTPAGQRALWGIPHDHDAGPRPEATEVQPPDDGIQAKAS